MVSLKRDVIIISFLARECKRLFYHPAIKTTEIKCLNLLSYLYMIFTDSGIILLRQDFREADRIVSLYTKEHGRINVRLPGVARSVGKLKALSEPFVCADYRIYIRRGGTIGTVTGGKINQVFPHIRQDLKKLALAFHFCELLYRMTPLHQPSPGKFDLLLHALQAVEKGPAHSSFQAAFTLRLMMLAGFGLDHPVLNILAEFWQQMHQAPLEQLDFSLPEDLLALAKCNTICHRFLSQYLTYPLHTQHSFTLQEDWEAISDEKTMPDRHELIAQPSH